MTQEDPDTAMVLAAGLGLRLRPLTTKLPKPLVELAGRTLLDRALDHLHAFGVSTVVINLHYLGNLIEAHLAHRIHRPLSIRTKRTCCWKLGAA